MLFSGSPSLTTSTRPIYQLTRIDTDNVSAISSSDPAKEMSLTRRVKFTTHLLEQQLDPSFQAFDAAS